MAKFFTDEADVMLKKWLSPATWDSDHTSDEGRFYCFVAVLARQGGFYDIGIELLEAVEYYHPDTDLNSVKNRVFELASNARIVFDYLEAQKGRE